MPHKIALKKRPKELLDGLNKIDKDMYGKIARAIKMIGDNPKDPKPYRPSTSPHPDHRGLENVFRIWVGSCGVHYQIIDAEQKVTVLRIGLPMTVLKAIDKIKPKAPPRERVEKPKPKVT